MNHLSREAIPQVALDLASTFREPGFGLWLVGGWVRDALLGKVEADLDLATDARPEQSLEILKQWSRSPPWTTGFEFGTVGVHHQGMRIEVTTFRTEVYHRDSRNPSVTFGHDLHTDLSRRDFTINAMAIALPEVLLEDPFGGLNDLVAKRIRTPLPPRVSFSDDPLRMLRALRFMSTLGFRPEPEVLEAIEKMHDRLAIVSAERIRDELSKLMLGGSPSEALDAATESGLAEEFLPELPALKLEQDPIHRHKDVFRHSLAVLDNVTAVDKHDPDLALRLAALLHDIGKPKTRAFTAKGVTFHHHEVVGAQMAEARLAELRYPSRLVNEVKQLVYLHLRFHTYALGWTDRAVRRYVRDAGPLLWKLNALVRADCTTRNPAKAARLAKRMDELEDRIAELESKEELSRLRPALNGNEVMAYLGIEPGPLVGEALDFLMEIRLDEGEIGKQEAYARLDEWFRNRSGS
ncbi:MAG: CCA tRNA nucleotidyltransferase [Actinomycetota bacterium]|nr:CCA tRNA nucleotidyltransferase [Actinomycetota bacterium]